MTSPFPDTQWSQIRRASEESDAGSREEMGKLLQQYWRPMFVHLRYKGLGEQAAEDLIQDFVVEILSNNLLSVADPKKGRFRTLLLTALDRFMVSRFRYERAAKRSPGAIASLDQLDLDGSHDAESEAGLAFERAWALDVLAETVSRVEQECLDAGEAVRWDVFRRRIIGPLMEDIPLADYEELAEEYHLDSPKQAMNLVITAKRQFARALREVIREYVTRHPRVIRVATGSGDRLRTARGDSLSDLLKGSKVTQQVEQELNDLRDILSRSGSVSDLALEFQHDTGGSEQRKPEYWNRLTQDVVPTSKPWDALFTLGTEQSEENLAAAYREIMQFDVGRDLKVEGWNGKSIREFLLSGSSELRVLRFLKSTMNLQRIQKNPTWPLLVVNAVYYLIVAVALLQHDTRISGLEDPQLASALEWTLEQSWIDDAFRVTLGEARTRVQSGNAGQPMSRS